MVPSRISLPDWTQKLTHGLNLVQWPTLDTTTMLSLLTAISSSLAAVASWRLKSVNYLAELCPVQHKNRPLTTITIGPSSF